MAAHEALHSGQFFHGSPHHFAAGDTVNPTSDGIAYAAKNPEDAAFFGTAKGSRSAQRPLFVPVFEVSSPTATPSRKGAPGQYAVSKEGFNVDKLHGYYRSYDLPDRSSKFKDRKL